MTKDEFMREILQTENAFVHLDPRSPHVVVPTHLKKDPCLVLLLGYDMVVPIVDLQIDATAGVNDGISGTLSFSRTPFRVFVPWSVVYGIVGSATARFCMWLDTLPDELRAEVNNNASAHPVASNSKNSRSNPAGLRLVRRHNPAGLRLVKNEK